MLYDVRMPDIGATSDMYLAAWIKETGLGVQAGDVIAEVQTDKVNSEIPSPVSGTVVELLVEEGERVTVGQVMARLRRPE